MRNSNKRNLIIIFFILFLLIIFIGFYCISIIKKSTDKKSPIVIAKKEQVKNLLPKNKKKPEITASEIFEAETNEPDIDTTVEEKEIIEKKIEKPEAESKELTSIFIPQTKSLFNKQDLSEDALLSRPRMSPDQWENTNWEEVKKKFHLQNVSVNDLIAGKIYYQGENGKLESFIYIDQSKNLHEYLISSDSNGFYADCVEIGYWVLESGEKNYATLSNYKLLIYKSLPVKWGKKTEESVTEYFISPQMQFNKGKTFSKL
jgi:hypothetical protein